MRGGHYHPALVTSPLDYADGQQRGEVYQWGSFLQSKMYAMGVSCDFERWSRKTNRHKLKSTNGD